MSAGRKELLIATVLLLVPLAVAPYAEPRHPISQIHPVDADLNMSDQRVINVSLLRLNDGSTNTGLVFDDYAIRDSGNTHILRLDDSEAEFVLEGSDLNMSDGKIIFGSGMPVEIGRGTEAISPDDVAIGQVAWAGGSGGYDDAKVAIGYHANASDGGAIAIGEYSSAEDPYSVAIGRTSTASDSYTLASGYYAEATASDAVALGSSASATGSSSTALGDSAGASGQDSVAVGSNSYGSGTKSLSLGASSTAGGYAVASGYNADASSIGAVAQGPNTVAGFRSIAVGDTAEAPADYSFAAGYESEAPRENSIVMGKYAGYSNTNGKNAVLIAPSTSGYPSTADNFSVAIGYKARALERGDVAIGRSAYANGLDSDTGSVAVGNNSWAGWKRSVAIGDSSYAIGKYSVAVGEATNKKHSLGGRDYTTAIGTYAHTLADYSIALGSGANATAIGAVAIGRGAKAPNSYEATFGNLNGQELAVNVTGNLTVHGACSGCVDIAEFYNSSEPVESGEIVMVDDDNRKTVEKASREGREKALGVVTTNPAILFEEDKISAAKNYTNDPMRPGVALTGRVPVKVNMENGPIKPGDLVTISSKDGVGMKANSSGKVIGTALEPYTEESEDDSIFVFVNTHNYVKPEKLEKLEEENQELEERLERMEEVVCEDSKDASFCN